GTCKCYLILQHLVLASKSDAPDTSTHRGSYCHGDDLAPGVNARPVPAQDIDRSGSETDIQDEIPPLVDGVELHSGVAGSEHQQHREDLADDHVVSLGCGPHQEALVEI